MNRPAHLIAVVGTHTDVGKTWVSEAVLSRWRLGGRRVAARKPVQSFAQETGATDAERLAAASGEDAHTICAPNRWYPRAMAPPMAANVLERPHFKIADLLGELRWPSGIDFGLVETVGGVLSPMAHDGSSADFVRRISPDEVLLIADAGLNAISAVRLSMQCLDPGRTRVFLNRFDANEAVHRLNAEWLAREGTMVLTRVDELL